MAMHNAAILASEIKGLKAINKRQKRKRNTKRIYIATEGILTTGQGQDRVKKARIADYAVLNKAIMRISTRTPPKCSLYRWLECNARICFTRIL